jgi:hypothetical protein
MSFFDRLFAHVHAPAPDARLAAATEAVARRVDPQLLRVDQATARLLPAVARALDFARALIADLPPSVELGAAHWGQTPVLRAVFARPQEIDALLSQSDDVRDYLAHQPVPPGQYLYGAVGATRVERTVLGAAVEGEVLRQDVAQKAISFTDLRLVGFAADEAGLRLRLEALVLDQLVLAALDGFTQARQRGEQLETYRQLLLARQRLLQRQGAGLEAPADGLGDSARHELKAEGEANAAALAALAEMGAPPARLELCLEHLIAALSHPETVIRPTPLRLHLNAMNIEVDAAAGNDAATVDLLEFSTVDPERPRRVAFLVRFRRDSVVERHMDFDAALRSL